MAIALVLACFFKTFLAELFVIPTGSMAPTLRGLHKDVAATDGTGYWHAYGVQEGPGTIDSAITPLYGMEMPLEQVAGKAAPEVRALSYSGDRILVNKFAYAVSDPERWDVVVFKCPTCAGTNYIKRLVGKPGETLRVYRGDLWVRPAGGNDFAVVGKPLLTMQEMRQIVFDTDYALAPDKGWPPERWVDGAAPESWGGAWKSRYTAKNAAGRDVNAEYDLATASPQAAWLRYQHTLPTVLDWRKYEASKGTRAPAVRRRLVTDFSPYNSGASPGVDADLTSTTSRGYLGNNWVGDLCIEAEIEVQEASTPESVVALELVEAGEAFQLRFRLSDGVAELYRGELKLASSKKPTPFRGVGKHTVAFFNFDDRLEALVDGERIEFDSDGRYAPPAETIPTAKDLFPAAVGGVQVKLAARHLRIWRDIYYTTQQSNDKPDDFLFPRPFSSVEGWADFYATPERWAEVYKGALRHLEFALAADQFFVMGDNSTSSLDARYWHGVNYVDRRLMLGKALFIYWPHGWETPWSIEVSGDFFRRGWRNLLPSTSGSTIRVPFYPNFGRMKFIR